jgi:Ca2+-binding RTX toxin-like protein
VDAANDLVVEAGGGIDTVKSSVTEMLAGGVENLKLIGSGAINGIGNTLGNILTGNANDNVLDGKGGADTLRGLGGNDKLVWAAADTYDGGAGTDKLKVTAANLDLSAIANTKILNVEQMDLRGGVDKTLTVTRADVLALSSTTDVLKVFGDSGDEVNAAGFTRLANLGGFQRFKSGGAVLLVETEVNVVT